MLPKLASDRFTAEAGVRILVQVPDARASALLDAVLAVDPLAYGDYDRVSFRTASGTQRFRSLGHGRNAAMAEAVGVDCVELSFFLPEDDALCTRVIEAIYAAHPYEEPVLFVQPCLRGRHIRGMDEDNPNRFWNRPPEAWVPADPRPKG